MDRKPRAFRVGEVAQELGIAPSHVRILIARGEIPSIRIGRCVRVPSDGLDAWIARKTITGGLDRAR